MSQSTIPATRPTRAEPFPGERPVTLETAREQLTEIARNRGFDGRVVVLAEPELALGDCKIEWADGGVMLDRAATENKIDELVGRYMASRNRTAG